MWVAGCQTIRVASARRLMESLSPTAEHKVGVIKKCMHASLLSFFTCFLPCMHTGIWFYLFFLDFGFTSVCFIIFLLSKLLQGKI